MWVLKGCRCGCVLLLVLVLVLVLVMVLVLADLGHEGDVSLWRCVVATAVADAASALSCC